MTSPISQGAGAGKIMAEAAEAGQAKSGTGPADTFEKMLNETAQNLKQADQSILQTNTGGPAALHDVMIAMEKADISLRLLVQVRNKAVDAYKEIMRMQV
ncbi:MAG: flagellar hook-basal body complex protein FliE [Desulfobacteraceae bacterium]|nr:flagellar hook-basal body complex protein FliE [Desulfobacteraceae bacterium]MCF8094275.1 flagellar hook-basal body complex protein FliE [Desulfobacteraceae bacterium]